MNRKYTIEEFKNLTNYIRQKNKYSGITTDYIVGFPTETEEDQKLSLQFLKDIKFSDMHIFPYSPRKNTPAANMQQINGKIKTNRFNQIEMLNNQNKKDFYNKFKNENKELEVLFETFENGIATGHSSEFIKVIVKTNKNLTNEIHKVKIKNILGQIIIATIVE